MQNTNFYRKAIRSICGLTLSVIAVLSSFQNLAAQGTEPAADAPPSPFGIGADHHTSQTPEKWIPQMSAMGIKEVRSCHLNWDYVEPAEGKWDWSGVDKQMDCMAANQMEAGGTLVGFPSWNTKDRPGTLPIHNLPAWSTYVTETVKHLKGKVKYWEIWNEPPNFTGHDQNPEDYAKIVVSAYDAIKAVDPTCQVGLAAKSVHLNYLQQVIKAGAKDHFDFITLHPYEVLGGVLRNDGTESVFMHIVPTVRKMLADVDPAKANAQIRFTELGVDSSPPGKDYGMGPDVAATGLIKAYTMGIAEGVSCIYWFEGMDGDSGAMGLLDATGKPRLTFTAMSQMIQHLGSHPTFLGWVLLNDKDYGFIFQGAKGPVLIAWAAKNGSDNLDFGKPVSISDPVTGKNANASTYTLTTIPIIVDDPPANVVALASSNKSKPFPWDGAYTDAKSVSVTFGEKTDEKGLHTQAGDKIAADVLAYGGSARSGDVPGGNMFIIDPNFLSYTATPVRITAVVRGNAANDPAGFKLVYESGTHTGFKNADGWYTVPDNKTWHTATWDLTDAQFVNFYGYNFSFNSDGNKLNKYDIQSVTVTKLDK